MAGFEAERLLDALLSVLQEFLPTALESVATEHDALDLVASRALTTLEAPRQWLFGEDPLIIAHPIEDYPMVAVAGGSRHTPPSPWGEASPTYYEAAIEFWNVSLTREGVPRRSFRYAKAVVNVLHAVRSLPVPGVGLVEFAPQDAWEPTVEIGDITALRDDQNISGIGAPDPYYGQGGRVLVSLRV